MKIRFLILLSLMVNLNFAQKKQCYINYNVINKVFYSKSIEEIDTQLNKYGYVFDFNSDYTNYFNKVQRSNFSIYWTEEKSNINYINVNVNASCYDSFKQEIINRGFVKVYEKMSKYRIDLYYKKNQEYFILGKTSYFNLDGKVTGNGFDVSLITEDQYLEFINK